jgi:hypothetical protein
MLALDAIADTGYIVPCIMYKTAVVLSANVIVTLADAILFIIALDGFDEDVPTTP